MGSNYAFLQSIKDKPTRDAVKIALDRLAVLEGKVPAIGTVSQALTSHLDSGNNRLTNLAAPVAKADAVTLDYLRRYVEARVGLVVAAPAGVPPVVPTPGPTPTDSGLTCFTSRAVGQPAGIPAAPNIRWWRGDMCGINLPGLPAVAGGAADPNLVLTWFIDRYSPVDQAAIIAEYKARGYTHWLLSWPDSRVGGGVGSPGQSVAQFVATAQMIKANGLYPATFLFSKDFDGSDPNPALVDPVIAGLQAGGVADIMSVGWELDLFNTPGPPIQAMIDHIAALVVPATNLYVHFSAGIVAWQADGDLGSVFWNANVNKLTGILHQKPISWDCGMYQARLADLLVRFGAGAAGWPSASGFGHPFDTVACEYSAVARFAGSMSEGDAMIVGNQAICSPGQDSGPPPTPVMGFNNGGPAV